MKKYLLTIGDALSQLANAVFFNSGNANESISGRSYANRHRWYWHCSYTVINAFFRLFGQKDHCADAFLKDRQRAVKLMGRYPDQNVLVVEAKRLVNG